VLASSTQRGRHERMAKMKKHKGLKPGMRAPASGQYQEKGPRGRKGREVTSVKDEPLPPPTKRGCTYELVDATKNRSGRGK
jgi:hypothetical protein